MLELSNAIKNVDRAGHEASLSTSEMRDNAHTHVGVLLSLLTELLGSYMPGKQAFMSVLSENTLDFGLSGKIGLSSVINDLVCGLSLQRDLAYDNNDGRPVESAHRLVLSGWAMSMIVALCSDVRSQGEDRDTVEETNSIRKVVLDVIVKAIKDTALTDIDVRYGRLWAIGDLIYRLLVAKPSFVPHRQQQISSPIARIMLERNIVGLITTAIGDFDLNFPDIRIVLVSLLRPLEYL